MSLTLKIGIGLHPNVKVFMMTTLMIMTIIIIIIIVIIKHFINATYQPWCDELLLHIAHVSNVCNTTNSNGDLDPWSAGGVLESPNPSLVSIVIKDAAHHLDLRSSNPEDTEAVIAARMKEKTVVKRWLRHYWHRSRSTTEQVQYDKITATAATTANAVSATAEEDTVSK